MNSVHCHTMRGWLLLTGALLAGCGQAPTAPDPVPAPTIYSLAGVWTGRMTFHWQGQSNRSFDVRVPLAQDGLAVTGHWTVIAPEGNDAGGLIRVTLDALAPETRVTGVVEWDSPAVSGPRCRGQAAIAGTAASSVLRWESSGFQFENCSDPLTQIVWVLTRALEPAL